MGLRDYSVPTEDDIILWSAKFPWNYDFPEIWTEYSYKFALLPLIEIVIKAHVAGKDAEVAPVWEQLQKAAFDLVREVNSTKYHANIISFEQQKGLMWIRKRGHWPDYTRDEYRDLAQQIRWENKNAKDRQTENVATVQS